MIGWATQGLWRTKDSSPSISIYSRRYKIQPDAIDLLKRKNERKATKCTRAMFVLATSGDGDCSGGASGVSLCPFPVVEAPKKKRIKKPQTINVHVGRVTAVRFLKGSSFHSPSSGEEKKEEQDQKEYQKDEEEEEKIRIVSIASNCDAIAIYTVLKNKTSFDFDINSDDDGDCSIPVLGENSNSSVRNHPKNYYPSHCTRASDFL